MERVLKTWPRSLALLICLLAAAGSALATTVVTPSDDDLIIGARAIVRAKVLSIESGFDERHTSIYTYITLKVQEVLKGEITERRIVIKELGGQVGDRISVIYGNPHFMRGERVLLYLDTWKDGSLRTYQMFLGKFSVVKDPKTGHEFAVRDSGDENVVVLPASVGARRAASTDRMELSSYLGMVREKLADNIERSRTFEETYYRDIPKLAAPPDYHKGGGEIQPLFTLISPSNPARWPEPDTNDPVPYTVNPDGAPNSQIVNDVAAAASAWSVVPGCALRVSYSGNLDQCYTGAGSPGINVVFNNCDGRNSPSPTCANILAWGGYSGARFAPKVVSGTTFNFEITQGFISFNPYASCNFGNSCIVREITTHEMGHALGLGHSADTTATMYAIAHFDGRCASIKQDDANGIAFIYPGVGGGPGPLSIVTATLPAGTVSSAYSQTMAASGGTAPYHWSVLAGSGALPPGLSLSDSGVLSGSPTTAGTYNFTIRVTDTGSGSAQKAFSVVVGAAGTAYDSQFVSQTVSTTLTPGQTFIANLVWLNTGTQTWDGPSGALRLVSQNPLNNTTWGGNTVMLSPFTVAAGQQLNVSFQAIAPTAPGTYNFQWRLARDATSLFGQMSANVSITVGSGGGGGGGGGGTNGASFVSQSVPAAMTAGQPAAVSVTMSNTGSTTWSP
ncbi:MAG: putative Ig domain-containing protein, partial [Blastocatellia bacterium]